MSVIVFSIKNSEAFTHRRTGRGATSPPNFGEDQIQANSSGRIGKNKFLSVFKREKFSKIGDDEQEFGY